MLKEVPHYQVPHGSCINFDKCPIKLLPDYVMHNYLKARDLAPKGHASRNRLIKLMQDVHHQENKGPKPKSIT